MEELEGQTLSQLRREFEKWFNARYQLAKFNANCYNHGRHIQSQAEKHELWRTPVIDYRALLKKYLRASGLAQSRVQDSREQCLEETGGVEFSKSEWQELEKLVSESE